MDNYLPSGKLHFVEGWQPKDDDELVVLVWQTRSSAPEAESSFFTGEVIRGTELIDVVNSPTLDGLRLLLSIRYGQNRDSGDMHDPAAHLMQDPLIGV